MTAIATSAFTRLGTRVFKLARGGTASVVAGSAYTNALRIVSSMTLTRLLDPDAFGVVGVVMSVSLILAMLSDVGLYPFIVRHDQGMDESFLDEVWTLRLWRSVALTAAMAAAAWPAATFMGKPMLAPILAVYSLTFLIEGCSSLAFATAVREGRLWRLTLLEALTATIQLLFAVALAVVFRSSWTLVLAMLASSVVRCGLSYTIFPAARRRFAPNAARARELWAFSRLIAMSSLLSLLILQADKLVLARLMPLAQYGHYVIAATLATAPLAVAYGYGQRVLYPAYAEAAREGRLAQVFYARRRMVLLPFTATCGALAGGAELVVTLLYDPRYAEVGSLLAMLAVSTALHPANISADEALIATGTPRWTFWANVTRVVWLATGGGTAIALGRTDLLVLVVGLMEAAALPCYWLGLHRTRILQASEEALTLAAVAAGAGAGYAATLAARALGIS